MVTVPGYQAFYLLKVYFKIQISSKRQLKVYKFQKKFFWSLISDKPNNDKIVAKGKFSLVKENLFCSTQSSAQYQYLRNN